MGDKHTFEVVEETVKEVFVKVKYTSYFYTIN